MSIQKKSLISTLKTTKKANLAASPVAENNAKKETVSSMRFLRSQKDVKLRSVKSNRAVNFKGAKPA